jgi:hypothetical protein
MVAEQTAGQGRGIVESASDRDRLFGQRPGLRTIGRHGVLQLPGQGGDHARLGRCAAAGQGLARRVQYLDQVGAGHGEAGTNPVQAQRDSRDQLGFTAHRCPSPRTVEQCARLRSVACAKPQVGLGSKKADKISVR